MSLELDNRDDAGIRPISWTRRRDPNEGDLPLRLIHTYPHRHPRPGTEPITIDTQSTRIRFLEGSGVTLPQDRLYRLRFLLPGVWGIRVCRKPVLAEMGFVGRIGLNDAKMTEECHIIRPGIGIVESSKECAARRGILRYLIHFLEEIPFRMNAGVSPI